MKEPNQNMTTMNLVMTAVCTALLAVLSQISIPLPAGVPISMQTFGIALCGYLLGWRWGGVSYGVYLLLGAVGVPVFTGLKGGAGCLLGLTGGFLWGFLPMVLLCGVLGGAKLKKQRKNAVLGIALGLGGLALCHLAGTFWYSFVSKNALWPSFLSVSMPFILKDVLSVAAGYFLALAVRNGLVRAGVVSQRAV